MTEPNKHTGNARDRDPDLANAEIALKRAAQKAREKARETGVPVVIMKDGKIMEEQDNDYAHTDH